MPPSGQRYEAQSIGQTGVGKHQPRHLGPAGFDDDAFPGLVGLQGAQMRREEKTGTVVLLLLLARRSRKADQQQRDEQQPGGRQQLEMPPHSVKFRYGNGKDGGAIVLPQPLAMMDEKDRQKQNTGPESHLESGDGILVPPQEKDIQQCENQSHTPATNFWRDGHTGAFGK